MFAADARSRALAPQTIKLRQNQIHAAVTALVESGIKPAAIKSLADLVSPENFKRILRRRYETVGGRENVFNCDLARALVQIARQRAKVGTGVLAELTRLAGKIPMPILRPLDFWEKELTRLRINAIGGDDEIVLLARPVREHDDYMITDLLDCCVGAPHAHRDTACTRGVSARIRPNSGRMMPPPPGTSEPTTFGAEISPIFRPSGVKRSTPSDVKPHFLNSPKMPIVSRARNGAQKLP